MENIKCPICKHEKAFNENNKVECNRCGMFSIDDDWAGINDIDIDVLNKIEKYSAKIAGYIRLQNEVQKVEPIITNDNIDKILMDPTLPNDNDIEKKAEFLLESLKRRTQHFGNSVKLKNEEDYPLAFAKNIEEYVALLQFLEEGNYLKIIDQTFDFFIVKLTPKGWKNFINNDSTMQLKKEKPLVFISYASEEVRYADFIKKVLNRWTEDKIEIFIARRDISSGEDPLKVMMDQKLKNADAIVPICTEKSKKTGWLWWESGAVWSKGRGVYPLFVNILPNDFGAPLILVKQGKDYFDKKELFETIDSICKELKVENKVKDFIDAESEEYKKLKDVGNLVIINKLKPNSKLEILSAEYGCGQHRKDVKDKLNSEIHGDILNVYVGNQLVDGNDPCPSTDKDIIVKYRFKDQYHEVTVLERKDLVLPKLYAEIQVTKSSGLLWNYKVNHDNSYLIDTTSLPRCATHGWPIKKIDTIYQCSKNDFSCAESEYSSILQTANDKIKKEIKDQTD